MYRYIATKEADVSEEDRINARFSQKAAQCGAVLLENDGTLPLKQDKKIALYGPGAIYTATSGLGAAGVNCRNTVCIKDGLLAAGVELSNKSYLQSAVTQLDEQYTSYYNWLKEYCNGDLLLGVRTMYANPFISKHEPVITKADVAESDTDTAVYVLTRNSGEGSDRKDTPGDFKLTDNEKENLAFLDEHYEHLIILLNVGGPVDLRQIKALKHLSAVLFIGLGGCAAGTAVAQLMLGHHVPEGKLTATWGYSYEDYADAYKGDSMDPDAYYIDGVYVGYRYFDSFRKEPAYPFGHGLSYTQFEITVKKFTWKNSAAHVSVTVKNVGNCDGRETVQLYLSKPQGELKQPYQGLVCFKKTKCLKPDEIQKLTVVVPAREMASYSETENAWIMEPGRYKFRVGASSRETTIAGGIQLCNKAVLEQCYKLFEKDTELEEIQPNCAATKEHIDQLIVVEHIDLPVVDHSTEKEFSKIPANYNENALFTDVLSRKMSIQAFVGALSVEELAMLCVGNVPKKRNSDTRGAVMTAGAAADDAQNGADQRALEDMVPGAAITTRAMMDTRNLPKINMADGSSGIRLVPVYSVDGNGNLLTNGIFSVQGTEKFADTLPGQEEGAAEIYYQYATSLPMATLLAQSWDEELLVHCGEMISQEMRKFGLKVWLAPALNIQRSPMCGRNFEYFSEDPLISGFCAGALVRGVQKNGDLGATIKHLACNNQEDDRFGINVHISERTFREIYLKGFEMVIAEENPMAIMTSLNLINGVHTANSYPMLKTLLRDEWNYQGIVMTDWGTTVKVDAEKFKYPCANPATCIECGNDLIMPGTQDDVDAVIRAVNCGMLQLGKLQECACRILKMMVQLNENVKEN